MIKHIGFDHLKRTHLTQLARSIEAAPKGIRPSDILHRIRYGYAHAFEWDGGLIVVSVDKPRLNVDAFCCKETFKPERDAKMLTADLKRLAADWQCDTIATIVFDPRLASVIQHLGGSVESWSLTLAVE